jgi:transcriptional regulator with XRE-family HTH domain
MRQAKRLGNLLSRTLYRRGWTESDLAERSGIARPRVNLIKNGRVEPTVAEALAICGALRCRVDEVFGLEEQADDALTPE